VHVLELRARRRGDLRQALAEAGIRLLVQGEAPLVKLLHDKLADPTVGPRRTDSLWEGIDLPGEALTLVIIARFPFAQPGQPLTDARLAAIAARGGDPFLEHSLPEAIVKFRQGFGRLIRRGSDDRDGRHPRPRAQHRGRTGAGFSRRSSEGVLQSRVLMPILHSMP
jgi:ATP-dependent DNA helicase DinG